MKYSVEFRPVVLKDLKRLSKKDLQRIKKKIDKIAESLPDPNTTRMKGSNSFHKVRSGDYRIIYEIDNNQVYIHSVLDGRRNIQEILSERLLR